MSSNIAIFLSGPIFQCEDEECIDWRQFVKQQLSGFTIFNPMDRDFRNRTDAHYQELVEQDKSDIDRSHILLVNHLKPSVGTSMEILYAWEREKHIVVVVHNDPVNPWLRYHSHFICHDLESAMDYIIKRFPLAI